MLLPVGIARYRSLTVTSSDRAWEQRAACLGASPDMFVLEKGKPAGPARAVCRTCPVAGQCFEYAVSIGEKRGVYAGTTERHRRNLGLVYVLRNHDYDPACRDPACRWCVTVNAKLAAALTEHRAGPVDTNGPSVTCGRKSTYARGHRDGACTFAISSVGRRLAAAGVDVPTWWARWFGANNGRNLVPHAKALAAFDLEPQQVAA